MLGHVSKSFRVPRHSKVPQGAQAASTELLVLRQPLSQPAVPLDPLLHASEYPRLEIPSKASTPGPQSVSPVALSSETVFSPQDTDRQQDTWSFVHPRPQGSALPGGIPVESQISVCFPKSSQSSSVNFIGHFARFQGYVCIISLNFIHASSQLCKLDLSPD